jgi:Dna[CI] antecedent, DciA
MDPIKNIVSEVIGRMSSSKGAAFEDIQAAWVKISKDQGSRVADIKDGCVTISADSSLRLVRLNLNREILLKELRREFPSIVKINFKVGAR